MKNEHKIALIAAILITAGLGVYALLKYREKKEKEEDKAFQAYANATPRYHLC